MSLLSLLKKEFHWSKHNVLTLIFILLLLPAFFASTSVVFETVIPRDAPIAVTPAEENTTESELDTITGSLEPFSKPKRVDSPAEAKRMLLREEVYAVVEVPHGIFNESRSVSFTLTVDGSIAPFEEASDAIQFLMQRALNRAPILNADISVERVVIDTENTLSEYLVPPFLMAIIMLFSFAYVPYNLAKERDVLDRIRSESSLEWVVAAKLIYFAVLMLVPILVFQAAAGYFGYAATAFAPGAVLALVLTFLFLAAISSAVMILLKFSSLGRFVNVVLLLATVAFSGMAFPVGYLSPLRRDIIRALPTHYSMVITRSMMLKDVSITLFTDWLLALGGFTLVTFLLVKLASIHYRRTI